MYQFHKQWVQKVLSSDVNGGLLADEARGCMAFMCTRGAYALILGSRTRGQPVCLTMGDVMLGGTMGVVMLGSTWLARKHDQKTRPRLLVSGHFDFLSNAANGIFYDCLGKGKHEPPRRKT